MFRLPTRRTMGMPRLQLHPRGMKPEQMRVYQLCEEFQEAVDELLEQLPPEARKIVNHLDRAKESAGLSLSEGLSAFNPRVKASYFDITRRETNECKKAMRRLVRRKFAPLSATFRSSNLGDALIGAMVNMIKQQEAREENEDRWSK